MVAVAKQEGMVEWTRRDAVKAAMVAINAFPNERTVEQQSSAVKPKFSSDSGTVYWLLLNFMKVVLGEDERAWSYFSGNLDYLSGQIGAQGTEMIRAYAKRIWDRHGLIRGQSTLQTITRRQPQQTTKQPESKPKPKAKVPTPELDRAIDIVDGLTKLGLPEIVKSSLEGVKSSLELARESKQGADGSYAKHIAGLAEAMFKTIGELVKHAGQDVALAAKAADQLGKIAKLFGGLGKAIGAVQAIHKIIYSTDRGERIDAAIDLITTFTGTVGFAAGISLTAFKWIWNTIGVPVKNLTEAIGLNAVFDGKSPEDVKAELDKLAASEPKVARWAIGKMRYSVFKPRSSPFAPNWNTRDAWERFLTAESGKNIDVRVADALKKGYTPGSDEMLDLLVVQTKERFRTLGHRFVDSVVAEARSWK